MKGQDSGSLDLVLLALYIHPVDDISNIFWLVEEVQHRVGQL